MEEVTVVLGGQSQSLSRPVQTPTSPQFPTKSLKMPAAQKGGEEPPPKCFSSPVSLLAGYQATHLSARTHPQLGQA